MRLHAVWIAALVWLGSETAAAGRLWHVDSRAAPGGDGLGWATAFDTLDAGLGAARAGDQVWVAAGRYWPRLLKQPGDRRSASFMIPPWVSVYGGFAGHETSLAARAGLFDQTVLSGDIGVPGDIRDNTYNVVTCLNLVYQTPEMRIDGFHISGGNADGADGPAWMTRGGGVTIQPSTAGVMTLPRVSIYHCILKDNRAIRGGALSARNFAQVRLLDCLIADNQAQEDGGGLRCSSTALFSVDNTWRNNTAGSRGGAVYIGSSADGAVNFIDDLFFDNQAPSGGAAYIVPSAVGFGYGTFEGCTVAFNSAGVGGAFCAEGFGRLNLVNTIVWDNRSLLGGPIAGSGPSIFVEFSDVEGGYPGRGNLAVDPLFLDPLARDLHTLPGSPVRDAGSTFHMSKDLLDLDHDGITGEPRPLDRDGARRVTNDPLAPDVGYGAPPMINIGPYEEK
jgi:hypothetical protein